MAPHLLVSPPPRHSAGRRPSAARLLFAATACAAAWLLPAPAAAQVGGYFSFNVGAQATSTRFDDHVEFTEFHEDGDFDAAYSVDPARVIDASGGLRLASGLGFGIGVSRIEKRDPASIEARLPHPFHFNRPRSITGSVPGLTRLENALHVELRWFAPIADAVELSLFGGPTFFDLEQDLVTAVEYEHTYPYDEAAFVGAPTAVREASAIGFHAGADAGFFLSRAFGVGATLRYSSGSAKLTSGNDRLVTVDAGGLQVGGGLRLRF